MGQSESGVEKGAVEKEASKECKFCKKKSKLKKAGKENELESRVVSQGINGIDT